MYKKQHRSKACVSACGLCASELALDHNSTMANETPAPRVNFLAKYGEVLKQKLSLDDGMFLPTTNQVGLYTTALGLSTKIPSQAARHTTTPHTEKPAHAQRDHTLCTARQALYQKGQGHCACHRRPDRRSRHRDHIPVAPTIHPSWRALANPRPGGSAICTTSRQGKAGQGPIPRGNREHHDPASRPG